ncbi:MAG: hypothetical protein HPY53_06150 [Brevinematales bacterium]|nr:hypothetical protein [Brevinematales bacterium]
MKIRKSLVSLFLFTAAIAAVMVVSPFGGRTAEAAPTPAGTPITNTATMTWGGGMSTNVATGMAFVGTNYGGVWSGNNSTNIAPGTHAYNHTSFENVGNLAVNYQFNATEFHSAAQWGTWVYDFTNTSGGAHGLPLTVSISPGAAVTTIWFHVYVPGNEVDSSYAQFKCVATGPNVTSIATNYTGYNTTVYGGNMAKWAAGYGKVILTNTTGAGNTNWRVTVQAALMVMSKYLIISNAGPFSGDVTRPFPGGILIWRLNYSNGGTVPATSVKIVDVFNTNFVTLKTDSLKSNAWGGVYPWAAAAFATNAAGDPGASTNGASVIFAPFTTTPLNGSTVVAAGKGAFYYVNYVK